MSLLLYISMILFSVIILNIKTTKNKYINFIVIATMLAILSYVLGSSVFQDRLVYDFMFFNRFPYTQWTWNSLLNNTIEPSFIVLNKLIYNVKKDPRILYFIATFVMVLVDLSIINKIADYKKKSLVLYLFSLQFFFGMFLVRQGLAATILSISYLFYKRENLLGAIIFVLLAASFHASALIVIPIYIVLQFSPNKSSMSYVYFFSLLALVLLFTLFLEFIFSMDIFYQYFGSYEGLNLGVASKSIFIKGIPYHLSLVLLLFNEKELREKIPNFNFYILLSILNSVLWFLSIRMYWMWRLTLYTTIPILSILPYTFNLSKNKKYNKFIEVTMILSLLIITLREYYLVVF